MRQRLSVHRPLVGVASFLLPPATYNNVREIYHRLLRARAHATGVHSRLSSQATNRMEQLSLLSAVARLFASLTRSSESTRKDVTLRLGGGVYTVDLSLMEADTLLELYRDRQHDQVAGFVPQKGWTVVDVGANVGMYAVLQCKRGATVYAFEANPDCYRRLVKTVRANRMEDSVVTRHLAIGSAPGWGVVTAPDGGRRTPAGAVAVFEGPLRGIDAVKVVPLDSLETLSRVERIDLLKVDVEGSEVEVLRGAPLTLSQVDRVVVEYHSLALDEQVSELLTESGFSLVTRVDVLRDLHVGLLYAERNDHGAVTPVVTQK